ncbi:IFRD-domain-containing protein [Basidiobolus meristosporus CBS 931.73]|uniref:IFRD-domain-containing protein n=1 Tax=Basidiobolus meristosporus CBS 931.73 TaxID=1314790 RepID=A0A1Y1WUJ2_9FUNG|nr:IFRD-domain-containing protein [Basidiobolus meristosporus CBS 931.73]|eukprot:ORX77075.1 IFRD-domain-containing protein [Basidiobolus meristosporus CBS 931.73]
MTHSTPKNLLKKAVRSSGKASNHSHTPTSSRNASDFEDEVFSEGSDSTIDSLSSFQDDWSIVDWNDEFKRIIEELSEKRTTTRESTLLKLIKALSHKFLDEDLQLQSESIIDTLKKCLKKSGSAREKILASKAITLCFITLGAGEESLYKDVSPILKNIVHNSAEPEVLSAAISALAMICFIASSDEFETLKLMDMFAIVFKDSHKLTQAAISAINAHGLLFTTVSPRLGRSMFDSVMPVLTRLLESPNTALRVASGENIALMIETLRDDTSTNFRYDGIQNLTRSLTALVTDSRKHRSKKDRSTQRSAFRDIVSSIEERNPPELKLKFRGEVITFTGWSEIKQLTAFREALAEGLHVHFQYNELLHDIFDVSLAPDAEGSSGYLPSLVVSPNSELSKLRTQGMAKQRQQRSRYESFNEDD